MSRSLLAICGGLIGSVGVVLTAGAALSVFEEAQFALVAGCGLIVSGAFIVRGRRAGAFALIAVSAATTAWSLPVGHLGSTPLSARLVGPIALLLITALLVPPLLRIRPTRTIVAFAALVAMIVLVGTLSQGPSSPRGAERQPSATSFTQARGSHHDPLDGRAMVALPAADDLGRSPPSRSALHRRIRRKEVGMTSLLNLPPPAFSELAWDVLLALHGHRRGQLDLARLSCLASAPPSAVSRAVATLESLQFVTVRPTGPGGQRRPLLTLYGCDLLERYFSAASGLQSVNVPHRQRAAQS